MLPGSPRTVAGTWCHRKAVPRSRSTTRLVPPRLQLSTGSMLAAYTWRLKLVVWCDESTWQQCALRPSTGQELGGAASQQASEPVLPCSCTAGRARLQSLKRGSALTQDSYLAEVAEVVGARQAADRRLHGQQVQRAVLGEPVEVLPPLCAKPVAGGCVSAAGPGELNRGLATGCLPRQRSSIAGLHLAWKPLGASHHPRILTAGGRSLLRMSA